MNNKIAAHLIKSGTVVQKNHKQQLVYVAFGQSSDNTEDLIFCHTSGSTALSIKKVQNVYLTLATGLKSHGHQAII